MGPTPIGSCGPDLGGAVRGLPGRSRGGPGLPPALEPRFGMIPIQAYGLSPGVFSKTQEKSTTTQYQSRTYEGPSRSAINMHSGCIRKQPASTATTAAEATALPCPMAFHAGAWQHRPIVAARNEHGEESLLADYPMDNAMASLVRENQVLRERIAYLESCCCRGTASKSMDIGSAIQEPQAKPLETALRPRINPPSTATVTNSPTDSTYPRAREIRSFTRDARALGHGHGARAIASLASIDASSSHQLGPRHPLQHHEADGGLIPGRCIQHRSSLLPTPKTLLNPVQPRMAQTSAPQQGLPGGSQCPKGQQTNWKSDSNGDVWTGVQLRCQTDTEDVLSCPRSVYSLRSGAFFWGERISDANGNRTLRDQHRHDAPATTVGNDAAFIESRCSGKRRYSIWSDEEERIFKQAYAIHGCKWNRIKAYLPGKSRQQVQSHGAYLIKRGVIKKFNSRRWTRHERGEAA
jgi:hypothetical protein